MALILIADDDETVRSVLSISLEHVGHTCHVAENGKDAVAKVLATEYDLIISDLSMPGMTGIEFLRTVSPKIDGVTPCMVITRQGNVQCAIDALQAGACGFISVPWDMQEMKVSVNRALQRRADLKFRREYQADLERRVQAAVAEVKSYYDGVVIGFASMFGGRNPSTAAHCARVRDLCARLGREMGLDAERIQSLELGAMLHDVGKCKIPDAILNKPDSLTEEEWAVMRLHPEYGAEIVERIPFLRGAAEVARHHHENFDGTGYPRALRGDAIPLAARIFAVVDAYDRITSTSLHKDAQTPDITLAEIRHGAGKQFDPDVVAAFERIYPEVAARTIADAVGQDPPEGATP